MVKLFQSIKDEHIFRSFIDEHPANILIISPMDGAVLFANKASLRFYGYLFEEMIKMNLSEINILSKSDMEIEMSNARIQKRHHLELVHKVKSGALKRVIVTNYPIEVENQTVFMSFISIKNDAETNAVHDFSKIFSKSDDLLVVIRNINQKIIYKSQSFINAFDHEWQHLNEPDLESYLSESSKEVWKKNLDLMKHQEPCILDFRNSKIESAFISYHTVPLKLQFNGEDVLLVKFEEELAQIRHSYELKDINRKQDELALNSNYGRLICIEVRGSEEENFDLGIIRGYFETIFPKSKWQYEFLDHPNGILLFTTIKGNEWLMAMYAFLADISHKVLVFSNVGRRYLQVGISMKAEWSSVLFDDLNEVMHTFKSEDRNAVHISNKTDDHYRWQIIKNDVKLSVKKNQLQLFKQDIYDLNAHAKRASEFLVRWIHPIKGVVNPGEFISYAESIGYIKDIDFWVIQAAFEYLSEKRENDIYYHINLSTLTLGDPDFIPYIHTLVEKYTLEVDRIVFEITESSNYALDSTSLSTLKNIGFKLAIDDFGTGYSSFERLKSLNVDWIKIDKSFIDGIFNSAEDVMILKAMIKLGHSLGIEIIAEGVETQRQLEFLYKNDCNLIQGYIFSKPHPILEDSMNLEVSVLSNATIRKDKTVTVLKGVFESYFFESPVAMFLLDDKYRMTFYNQATSDAFDLEMDTLEDSNFVSKVFTHKSEYQKAHECFMEAFSGEFDDVILERTQLSSKRQMMRWHISYLDEQGLFLCIVSDISEKIENHEKVLDFKTAIDGIDAAVLVVDVLGRISYYNKVSETMFLLSDEVNEAHIVDHLLINHHGPIISRLDWEGLYSLKGFKKDAKCEYRDGIERNCRITGYATFEQDLDKKKFVIMVQNIDLEKNLELTNENLRLKIIEQETISSVGLLATGLIHEISNPLTCIKTNYEFIKANINAFNITPPSLREEILEVFFEDGQGLEQISTLIMDLKRFIFKDSLTEFRNVDLAEVILTIVNLARNEYKHHAEVEVFYDHQSTYEVLGSSTKFKQIFLNLLMNASYAISINKPEEKGIIKFELINQMGIIKIVVTDNGCGIDEASLLEVYKPFYTTKPEGVGSGLGLSIVKEIIEKELHGSIEITSKVDVGTQVVILLNEIIK